MNIRGKNYLHPLPSQKMKYLVPETPANYDDLATFLTSTHVRGWKTYRE